MFSVTILGSNSASFSYGRHHTAQIVNLHHHVFLVDCGEGTQIQLQRHQVKYSQINHIFISHLHGDHYFGLIGLLSTFHLQGRVKALHVYGPSGLDEIITLNLKQSGSSLSYPLHFQPLEEAENPLISTSEYSISFFPVNHGLPCYGFSFTENSGKRRIKKEINISHLSHAEIKKLKEGTDILDEEGKVIHACNFYTDKPKPPKRYIYAADTKYDETLIPYFEHANLLYHEATFLHELAKQAEKRKHSTAQQAATIALKSKVEKLIIGHFSSRNKELAPLLQEAQAVFPNTSLALEGETFEVPDHEQ